MLKGFTMDEIKIQTEYITLGQFLKYVGLIDSGSEAKMFLAKTKVSIDGVEDNRRGRKLYDQTTLKIKNKEYIIIKDESDKE